MRTQSASFIFVTPSAARAVTAKVMAMRSVQMAVNLSSVEGTAALDYHTVFRFRDIRAHGGQILRHNPDSVGFLHLQLRRIPDDGAPLGHAGHSGDDGKLVDESGDDGSADFNAL